MKPQWKLKEERSMIGAETSVVFRRFVFSAMAPKVSAAMRRNANVFFILIFVLFQKKNSFYLKTILPCALS